MKTKEPSKSEPVQPTSPVFKPQNFFKTGNKFGGNMRSGGRPQFNPGTFKTQHKG
jgi:hypothetical protein